MTQESLTKKRTVHAEKTETDPGNSLGAYLQRERQKKQFTIEEVAAATRIPPEALQAIEAGQRHLLPVMVFTKGFVKLYAAHLGLDQAEVLERFSEEWGTPENTAPAVLSGERMAESSPFLLSSRFYLLLMLAALVAALVYFFFQADNLTPPALLGTAPSLQHQTEPHQTAANNDLPPQHIMPTTPTRDTLLISPQSAATVVPVETVDDSRPGEAVTPDMATATAPAPQQATASRPAAPEARSSRAARARELELHIRFVKKTHISVAPDDDRPEKFLFAPGEESSWQAKHRIALQIDDPGAVEMTLNGVPVPVATDNNGPLAITLPRDRER
jgi:cytoskeleton protein RodZ